MSRKGTVSEPDTKLQNTTGHGKVWTPERVIALRADLDLTQDAFAKLVKRSRQQVSGWENGTVAITRRMGATLTALEAKHVKAAPKAPDGPDGFLLGRASEVEALIAYALQRQQLLVQEMGQQYRASVLDRATQELRARLARPPQSTDE